jgi:CRISPR system Cascade subunit CasE
MEAKMFLSRVELGPSAAERDVFWREVSKPYGAHQALWKLFGRGPEQKRDFLYRFEDSGSRPSFLVLSVSTPQDDDRGLWRIETKTFEPVLRKGQRLGFRLRASPVVRRTDGVDGTQRRARRHDVVMDRKKRLARMGERSSSDSDLIRETGITWLERQAGRSGFQLVKASQEVIGDDGLFETATEMLPAVRVDEYRQHRILRRGERPIMFSTLDFEGVLEVVDPAILCAKVVQGFGPQKAFGCGLMLLRRA